MKYGLQSNCEECGAELKLHFNSAGRCTNIYCPNELCKGTVAMKVVDCLNVLGVKGVGYATALNTVMPKETHLDYLLRCNYLKGKYDPGVITKLLCIKGLATPPHSITKFEDFFKTTTYNGYENELKILEPFIEYHKPRGNRDVISVAITGEVYKFRSKEEFIYTMQVLLEDVAVIQYIQSARKTGVNYLIRDNEYATTRKVQYAVESGTPILTSSEFFNLMLSTYAGKIDLSKFN